jgi:hypothetical protein
METKDAVQLLLERMNHLEDLLVSSLLGLLITATFSVFVALYALRTQSKKALPTGVTPARVLLGVNVLYTFLGGYYYFMLAQFYAATAATLELTSNIPSMPVRQLWMVMKYPQIPFLSEEDRNLAMLLNAPLFPFLFACASITILWSVLRSDRPSRGLGYVALTSSIGWQGLVCWLMAWHPFTTFLEAAKIM